jgi:hypothetical protein
VTFHSARTKLRRADEHLKILGDLIDPFVGPYQEIVSANFQSGEREQLIRPMNLGPLPVDDCGLTIGDIVTNLRAVLDHIVWELSCHGADNPPSPPPKRSEKQIKFPVQATRNDGRIEIALWAVGPPGDPAREAIVNLQPFQISNRGQDPQLHPLWVLNELVNTDKHRTVAPVRSTVTVPVVQIMHMSGTTNEDFRFIGKQVQPGPYEPSTPVARLVYVGSEPGPPEVPVQVHFTFDVAFDQRSPAPQGDGVLKVLGHLRDHVAGVLNHFESTA